MIVLYKHDWQILKDNGQITPHLFTIINTNTQTKLGDNYLDFNNFNMQVALIPINTRGEDISYVMKKFNYYSFRYKVCHPHIEKENTRNQEIGNPQEFSSTLPKKIYTCIPWKNDQK